MCCTCNLHIFLCIWPWQWSITCLQCPHGLSDRRPFDVELWSRWNGLHSLERTAPSSAGIPHHGQCPYGPCFHQIPPRLDNVGSSGCHLRLGWVGRSLFVHYLDLAIWYGLLYIHGNKSKIKLLSGGWKLSPGHQILWLFCVRTDRWEFSSRLHRSETSLYFRHWSIHVSCWLSKIFLKCRRWS